MEKVTGVVEAIGTKFNGSLKVNDKWYNFKKGYISPEVTEGEKVTLTLQSWEFNGKSGVNIVNVELVAEEKPKAFVKKASVEEAVKATTGRDFNAEARGKTRCSLFAAALQSPVLQQYLYTKELTLDQILTEVKKVADEGTKYTFGE